MNELLNKKLDEVGIKVPNILLPKKGLDLSKFSCIAADQYTQNIAYWKKVKEYVGDSPSSYNLIYPEAYLEYELRNNKNNFDETLSKKIFNINNNMNNYLESGVFDEVGECFVYVERQINNVIRKGLVVAIDLEKYDYNSDSKSLIRASELTVKERLVVRKKIRENASIDMPHILVLINDKNDELFRYISKLDLDLLYDFNLMQYGGNIKGYKVSNESNINGIADILIKIKNRLSDGLLYIVGDGNHSLAAAKDIYEKNGKCRYALVEIVNIHDEGLQFFPIHRLLIDVDKDDFINKTGIDPSNPIPLQDLQIKIDNYGCKIDYIHGKEECLELGKKKNNIAIVYDNFSFETLFDDVIKYGSLCRKSFSIGEAKDKRYYLEAQKI